MSQVTEVKVLETGVVCKSAGHAETKRIPEKGRELQMDFI